MIIYWSMLLWVPFIYFIYCVASKNKEKPVHAGINDTSGLTGSVDAIKKENISIVYAILIFAFFTFWIGNRGYIYDTGAYIEKFKMLPTDFSAALSEINADSKAPGWDVFNAFFKCFISTDYHWWLMTIAIVSMICVLIPIRKYSCDLFFSSFVFIALSIYIWPMNGMRQFVCVAVTFACSHLIKDGKFFKFAIVVLLLSTIHYTCLLMLPIYFVVRSKPWTTRIFVFIIAIALVCVFAEPFFKGLEENVLSNTAYAGVTSQFDSDDGVNPLRALFYFVFPLLAYVRRKKLEAHYEEHPMMPIAVNMSFVAAMLYVVGIFTSGILIGRLPIYCNIYNVLLIPYIIKYGFDGKDKTMVRIGIVLILLVMFWLELPARYVSDLTGVIK